MPRKSVPRITAVIKVTLLLELAPAGGSATLGYASSIFDMYYNRVFSKGLTDCRACCCSETRRLLRLVDSIPGVVDSIVGAAEQFPRQVDSIAGVVDSIEFIRLTEPVVANRSAAYCIPLSQTQHIS
jgi:hypothetical protein